MSVNGGQLTELDSFFKAMRIIHYKALNTGDREEMLECTAAMDGVLDRTIELFEKLRQDILSRRTEA